MKIMRALSKGVIKNLPSIATKGCQSYDDILNELVVSHALSDLHTGVLKNGKQFYKTEFFCLIYETKVVSGSLERTLSKSKANLAADRSAEGQDENGNSSKLNLKEEDLKSLKEDDRMLMESLPHEYVVSVMKHDGQPLWWMITHKTLSADQLISVLVQVIVGIAIAERVYDYEHRDLHVSNILIKKDSREKIPYTIDGIQYNILSYGVKATIIDATFSRLAYKNKIYYRNLSSTLRAYGTKNTPVRMSLQNRSYRSMVQLTRNKWEEFNPKTNLIWLLYLCETLMKTEVMKKETKMLEEINKIRIYTAQLNNTMELLERLPKQDD